MMGFADLSLELRKLIWIYAIDLEDESKELLLSAWIAA